MKRVVFDLSPELIHKIDTIHLNMTLHQKQYGEDYTTKDKIYGYILELGLKSLEKM